MYRDQRILGVVLARGGSKGLPRKHLLPLLGRTVLDYTFDHAEESQLLDHLVCSTDDEGIARVCQDRSVRVIQRPDSLASDGATIEGAMLHACDRLASEGRAFDYCLVLYGCVPVRPPGVFDQAIRQLVDSGRDCLLAVADVGKFNPHWMFTQEGDSFTQFLPSTANRRQQLPSFFLGSGSVLLCRTEALRTPRPRTHLYSPFGDTLEFLVELPGQTVDIDSERDLLLAEATLQATRRRNGA